MATFIGTGGPDTIRPGNVSIGVSGPPGGPTGAPDVLRGLAGADDLHGGGGNDRIFGGANAVGIDVLRGGAGNDRLFGGSGEDDLFGGIGNDILRGGDGVDFLFGGRGADILIGGSDGDRFIFDSVADSPGGSANSDIVRGFDGAKSGGGDVFQLTEIDAVRGGTDDAFVLGGPFVAGHLRLHNAGTNTVLRGNTDGDAGAEFRVVIEDGANVVAADYDANEFPFL